MSIRVFISYSHDSEAHRSKVLKLADTLVENGVDVRLDQYEGTGPAGGWPIWMAQQITHAEFIVVVCTENYRRRSQGEERPGTGLGATWEGMLVTQVHYDDPLLSGKLVPILLDEEPVSSVPLHLKGLTRYVLPREYDGLYCHLTRQSVAPERPPLGSVVVMPQKAPPTLPSAWGALGARSAPVAPNPEEPGPVLIAALEARMNRAFYKAVLTTGHVVDRKIRRAKGPLLPLARMLDGFGVGLLLLVGETGLGKTTALATLARSMTDAGSRVLCLGARERWTAACAEVAREANMPIAVVEGAIQLVVWDEFSAADLPEAAAVVGRRVVVVAACTPAEAMTIEELHGTVPARAALQPLDLDAASTLYNSLRGDVRGGGGWLSMLPIGLREALGGNPLFVRLAADPSGGDPLPRLWQVAARHVASVGKRSSGGRDRAEAMTALARLAMESPRGAFSFDRAREVLRSSRAATEEDADRLLRESLGAGLLVAQTDWLRFVHEYLPIVVLAQSRAKQAEVTVASQAATAAEREIALLVPAFSASPLATLGEACPERTDLWLRGLCLLPHDSLDAGDLEGAIREYLWLEDEGHAPVNLERCVRQLSLGNGLADVLGLLDALLHIRSTDPMFLGSLLFLMDGMIDQGLDLVIPLRSQLFAHLPGAPPRPPTSMFRDGNRSFSLARCAVSVRDFAVPFPDASRRGKAKSAGAPQVAISWLAARAFARWMGGRLPTRHEWLTAAGAAPRSVSDPRVGLFPRTMRELSDRGPIDTDDTRLERDPAPSGCRQLYGNVREWCEDGPADAPSARWALGGSFQYEPGAHDSAAMSSSRGDVGLRICWDEQRQEHA